MFFQRNPHNLKRINITTSNKNNYAMTAQLKTSNAAFVVSI